MGSYACSRQRGAVVTASKRNLSRYGPLKRTGEPRVLLGCLSRRRQGRVIASSVVDCAFGYERGRAATG